MDHPSPAVLVYLRIVSSILMNKCHKELRKVWRQLYLIKWPYIQTQDNVKNINLLFCYKLYKRRRRMEVCPFSKQVLSPPSLNCVAGMNLNRFSKRQTNNITTHLTTCFNLLLHLNDLHIITLCCSSFIQLLFPYVL